MFGRNELVKLLVDNGADISLLDICGLAVFDLTAQQGNEAAIEIMERARQIS
nr:ankyrin repeat domain-containing protein [Dyadobacter frigoris]